MEGNTNNYPQGPPMHYPPPISPIQPGATFDANQAIAPVGAPQSQPQIQNAQPGPYYNAPTSDAEKGYYQPTYTVTPMPAAAPYDNPSNVVTNPDGSATGALPDTSGAMPPDYTGPLGEKKIFGLKRKTFWIALVIGIIVIIAIAGGVGGGVGGKKKKTITKPSRSSSSGGAGNNNNNNGGSGSGSGSGSDTNYTPFALKTGERTLTLQYNSNSGGSCNEPGNEGDSGIITCFANFTYTIKVKGDITNGYSIDSVDVGDYQFADVVGISPTTSIPTQNGSYWEFQYSFTDTGDCTYSRGFIFSLGGNDSDYAVEE
ncbi:hypothetical protein ABW20_dc0107786 [Dactylellina cionopaga]|nr:hypothetical protein ABW20_dc0107786 [Dactylellina cionopaga]